MINIGDMLEVLSAGTFVATAHRVRKVPHERYSFPLFFACDYHTLIRPLPTFLAAGEASEYQELSIGEHMWSRRCKPIAICARRSIAASSSCRRAHAAPIPLAI